MREGVRYNEGMFDVLEFKYPRNKVCVFEPMKRKTFLPPRSEELLRIGILKS
jgi:hypothetical protein